MSFLNYIPGVAHVKALTQLICKDEEGAERTMETFHTKTPIVAHVVAGIAKLAGEDKMAEKCWDGGNSSLNALPVVGHVKGVGHYICLDIEGGNKAMADATSTTLNIADGVPVVGHAKGVIHYVCRDVDGGNKAMKAATRTTAVIGAGAGGCLIGGPVLAVYSGVIAGAGWDTINASVTDWKEVNGLAKIIENPTSVDSYFDAGLSFVGDGMAGYSGGKIAKEVVRRVGNKAAGGNARAAAPAGEAKIAAAQHLVEDLDAGKITFEEYQQKWDAMKPKLNADQLQSYYDNGSITEKQYNQATKEMATAGGKNVTVNVPHKKKQAKTKQAKTNQAKTNQAPTSDGASGNQPPQKPTENKRSKPACRVLVLRQRLTELLNRIRQFISCYDGRRRSHADRQFQRESFRQIYEIVSELISNGHSVRITRDNYELEIFSLYDSCSWNEVIEYQVVDFLDIHDQLIRQQFTLGPPSSCPTVLSAEFQGSGLRLTRQVDHGGFTNVIYGIRCRLCDRRDCPSNISYVGQTIRSVHARVCGEHARSVANAIKDEVYDSGEASRRPMYEHAANHYQNNDVPPNTQPRNVFREVMDVILLPITGGREYLREWEYFWQFFLHCREFFWGWSKR